MSTLYAGIDLGGTTTSGVLADAQGQIVCQDTIATESYAGPTVVLKRIANLVRQLADKAGSKPAAVGLGCPGLVDDFCGVTQFLPNLPTQWRDVPAAQMLVDELGCPVLLLNDVRAATLGELTFGLGQAVSSMAYFSIGTGIGGGLVIDGELRLGPLGAAGELGHQTILPDGPLCGCGNRGCLEALASGPAIAAEGVRLMLAGQAPGLHAITGGNTALVTPATLGRAALAGDPGAQEAIARAAGYLGIGVANIVTCLHPALVVLGGGVAELGELLLGPVRQTVAKRVRMFPVNDVHIEQSQLGGNAGTLGAVALAVRGYRKLK